MQFIRQENNILIMSFTHEEAIKITRIVKTVFAYLGSEFEIRVEGEQKNVEEIEKKLDVSKLKKHEEIKTFFSEIEAGVIYSCFSEVCYGILINFHDQIGDSKENIKTMFDEFKKIYFQYRDLMKQQENK